MPSTTARRYYTQREANNSAPLCFLLVLSPRAVHLLALFEILPTTIHPFTRTWPPCSAPPKLISINWAVRWTTKLPWYVVMIREPSLFLQTNIGMPIFDLQVFRWQRLPRLPRPIVFRPIERHPFPHFRARQVPRIRSAVLQLHIVINSHPLLQLHRLRIIPILSISVPCRNLEWRRQSFPAFMFRSGVRSLGLRSRLGLALRNLLPRRLDLPRLGVVPCLTQPRRWYTTSLRFCRRWYNTRLRFCRRWCTTSFRFCVQHC